MDSIRTRAFAKINHSLIITGKRGDGYHTIRSHMQAISLHDDVTVHVHHHEDLPAHEAAVNGISVSVRARFADGKETPIPQGADNIAYRAAILVAEKYIGVHVAEGNGGAVRTEIDTDLVAAGGIHIEISIEKRIPMAAGLAGGSADAAAVLLSLAHLWVPDATVREIAALGVCIGADVPFCVATIAKNEPLLGYTNRTGAVCKEMFSAAICEGIGDEMTPLDADDIKQGGVILVKPPVAVSTPEMYAAWDDRAGGLSPANCRPCAQNAQVTQRAGTAQSGRITPLSAATETCNDLERVAVSAYPVIGEIMNEMKKFPNAGRVFMTGSGPTAIAYFPDKSAAARAYDSHASAMKNRADIDAVILAELL